MTSKKGSYTRVNSSKTKKKSHMPKIQTVKKTLSEDDDDGTGWLCRWCGKHPAKSIHSTKNFALCSEKCKKEYINYLENKPKIIL